MKSVCRPIPAVSVLLLLGTAAAARGGILEFSSALRAEVQRITDGFPDGQAATTVRVPDDTDVLPTEAIAFLTVKDAEGVGRGWAAVSFEDPLASVGAVPQELNVELVSHSPDGHTSFISEGEILESRTVMFTPQDTGRVLGERLRVNSQVFIKGAIVFWAPEVDDDLTDLSALVTVEVRQIIPGGEPFTLLEAAAIVDGAPGGQITVDADGAILPESLLPIDLTGTLADVGALHLVVIPNMVLPYTYQVVVGQEFVLEVEVTGELAGLPDGRGAALVLGGPFRDFGSIVDELLGTDLGTRLQEISNSQASVLSQIPPLPQVVFAVVPTCAAMGVETFGLALIAGVLCAVRSRRSCLP